MPGRMRPKEKVAAADLARNFGHWQDRALQSPVFVTHHGRERVVLLSCDAFDRLATAATAGTPTATSLGQQGGADLQAVLENAAESIVTFDSDLRIKVVNAPAAAMLGRPAHELVGVRIEDLAGDRAALLTDRLRAVLRSGSSIQYEAKGFLAPDRHVLNRIFPCDDGVALATYNLTEVYELRRRCEACKAEQAALDMLGMAARCSIDTMGFIDDACPTFAALVGFPPCQLRQVRFVDLALETQRTAITEGLHEVMIEARAGFVVDATLVAHDGARREVRIAAAPRRQDDRCTGLVLLLAPTL